jgi:hypothetical protein
VAFTRVASQVATASSAAAVTTQTVVLPATPTVGNVVVVAVGIVEGTTASTTFTVNAGAASNFTLIGTKLDNVDNLAVALYGKVIESGDTATVTVTLSRAENTALIAQEYSGEASPIVIDSAAAGTSQGTGSPVVTAGGPTTDAGDLAIAAFAQHGSITFSAPANGFSIVTQVIGTAGSGATKVSLALVDKIETVTETPTASMTSSSGTQTYAAVISALKPAGGAAPPAPATGAVGRSLLGVGL